LGIIYFTGVNGLQNDSNPSIKTLFREVKDAPFWGLGLHWQIIPRHLGCIPQISLGISNLTPINYIDLITTQEKHEKTS